MQKLASLKFECHAIMNKYPETASLLEQVYKVNSDIENLAEYTVDKVGESSFSFIHLFTFHGSLQWI
jgi:hypothetical protein